MPTTALQLLNKREAAARLRISVRTLDRLPIPRVKPPGCNKVLYREDTLDKWARENESLPDAQA